MTWLVATKPHYVVYFLCGHVKERCACAPPRFVRLTKDGQRSSTRLKRVRRTVAEMCPACADRPVAARREIALDER